MTSTTALSDTERMLARGRRAIEQHTSEVRCEYGREQMDAGWSESEYVETHVSGRILSDALRTIESLAVILAAGTDGTLDRGDQKILAGILPDILASLDGIRNL